MSSLYDDISKETLSGGVRCRACAVIEQYKGKAKAELLEAFQDTNVPASVLARVLVKRGHEVRSSSIIRHRQEMHDARR